GTRNNWVRECFYPRERFTLEPANILLLCMCKRTRTSVPDEERNVKHIVRVFSACRRAAIHSQSSSKGPSCRNLVERGAVINQHQAFMPPEHVGVARCPIYICDIGIKP